MAEPTSLTGASVVLANLRRRLPDHEPLSDNSRAHPGSRSLIRSEALVIRAPARLGAK